VEVGGQTKKIYRKTKPKSNKSSTLRKAKLNKKVIMLARTTCDEQGLGQGSVGEGCCRCLSAAMEAKAGDNPQQGNPKPQEAGNTLNRALLVPKCVVYLVI
jgi:hypothetical protein